MQVKLSQIFFSFLLITPVIFAGCAPQSPNIQANQLFQGYPCQDNCRDFAAGFEAARNQKFTQNENCASLSESLRLGCLTYLHEYRLEHDQPLGYVFPD